jgi:HK97 gp10 family phage protein
MGNVVNFEVKGLKEMNARIAALQQEFGSQNVPAGKWMMRALHDGARIIRDEAKRLAPVLKDADPRRTPGAIRDGLVEHASRESFNTVYVRVRTRGYIFGPNVTRGVRNNSALKGNPNYWWLQEFGTSTSPAQPFMRPAFDSKKGEALRVMLQSLRRGLDDIVSKLQRIRVAA